MKYAVISDVHANLEALTAVLRLIEREKVDSVVCLGDIVGYYTNPNECLQIIEELNIRTIAGNHDRVAAGLMEPTRFGEGAKIAIKWTLHKLTDNSIHILKSLPLIDIVDDAFIMVHGALYPEPNENDYITSIKDAQRNLKILQSVYRNHNICFFGHTHHSAAYEYCHGKIRKINSDSFEVKENSHYLVNPGSVGQPRDKDKRASLLIFDNHKKVIKFHRVSYDHLAAENKADLAGLTYVEGFLKKSANCIIDYTVAAVDVIKHRWKSQ